MTSKKDPRGGKRPGSGRKPKIEGQKVTTVSFCLTAGQKAALDEAAKSAGMRRSEYIIQKLGV